MDKAIFITDMPDNCFYCFCMESCEKLRKKNGIDIRNGLNGIPDCCPLKELPQDIPEKYINYDYIEGYSTIFKEGWDACINEILKDKG